MYVSSKLVQQNKIISQTNLKNALCVSKSVPSSKTHKSCKKWNHLGVFEVQRLTQTRSYPPHICDDVPAGRFPYINTLRQLTEVRAEGNLRMLQYQTERLEANIGPL